MAAQELPGVVDLLLLIWEASLPSVSESFISLEGEGTVVSDRHPN